MAHPGHPRAVFLSAGETSGDMHGASLARALLSLDPSLELYGIGGSRMEAAGVRLLADLDRLAVMGLAEIVRSLPRIAHLRRRIRQFLAERDIRLLIPIDFPGFNIPLAEGARRRGIRVLYYIAPQVWAWREHRARRLAASTDRVCVILPFEEEMLASHGVRAHFVGHPLLDGSRLGVSGLRDPGTERSGETLAGMGDESVTLALFPGSRRQEVKRILPIFLAAADRITRAQPGIQILIAREPDLAPYLYEASPYPLVTAEEAIAASRAALCKSGTITLQLAIAGVPMVVGYRMHPMTYQIAKRLVRVPHIALANLVAEERLVPELVQADLTPRALLTRVMPLLDETHTERQRIVRGLTEVRSRLGEPGCAARVARHALELLDAAG
jgi:lipid-A-disaccharide synthase